jgi:hypothetical protein
MDCLMLLKEARVAGLVVLADGDRLVVRGPRSAAAMAQRLLEHKAEVLRALATPAAGTIPAVAASVDHQDDPGGCDEDLDALAPCPACGSLDLWQTIVGNWRCQHCDAAALRRSRSWAEKAARLREQYERQRLAAEKQLLARDSKRVLRNRVP